MLPKAQLGAMGSGLDVGFGSGFEDNADAADRSFAPNDDALTMGRLGRLGGYGSSTTTSRATASCGGAAC